MLEHHPHLPAMDVDVHPHIRDVLPIEDYRAAGRILHAVETAQECALAASRRADDRDLLTLLDGRGDPF